MIECSMLTRFLRNKALKSNSYREALFWLSQGSLSEQGYTLQQLQLTLGLSQESCQSLLSALHTMSAPCFVRGDRFFFTVPWFLYKADLLAQSCGLQPQCVDVLWDTDSTQDQVKWLCDQKMEPCLVVAEYQAAGRGRQGAAWESGFAHNILFSYADSIPITPYVATLSLRIAVALCQSIKAFCGDIPLQVKWPNDLFLGGKKCAGLLLESESQGQNCVLVVGLGLNVNACLDETLGISEQNDTSGWRSLSEYVGCYIDKSKLVPVLVRAIKTAIQQGHKVPLDQDWQQQFAALDALSGQVVTYKQAGVRRQGLACGVDAQGGLVLRDQEGSEWTIHSGEVSQVRICT